MKRNNSLIFKLFNFYILAAAMLLSGCSNMLDTDSELVEYEKDNTLDNPTDSVYSVMGIIGRMQLIADRTVLLGEIRADLVQTTEAASADLKRLAAFDQTQQNKYNQVSDYYAVINNCNYYLAHIDTVLQRRGRTLFTYEYAAVKAFRAWTYLELVKAYGRVPLVTEPVMTEREAFNAANSTPKGIAEICDFFITDLTPYALTDLPQFGTISNYDSRNFFIPVRALLGDLCLWAGRYEEAARWYHDFLNDPDEPVEINYNNRIRWTSATDFQRPQNGYDVTSTREVLSFIPMEERVFDGVVSDLENIFCSTRENNYYFQVTPSMAMRQLSSSQIYCGAFPTQDGTTVDTVYVPRTGLSDDLLVGDLRLYSNYSINTIGGQDPYSEYSVSRQNIDKFPRRSITTYRRNMVYLRYAEALNRAGFPQSAFAVLKYGLCSENNRNYLDSIEQVRAGSLISFNENIFTRETTIGMHSIGSGESQCNAKFVLPQPDEPKASRQDTINFQIPLVENYIVNEMALEGAFEGYRFYDLMRVALRRNDASYLANAVSCRNGKTDETLRTLLLNTENWYLRLP
jgi:hypothetical protein